MIIDFIFALHYYFKNLFIMLQFVIRMYPGISTVYDFIFGHIVDGQFAPLPIDSCPFDLKYLIVEDTLLGGSAYIKSDMVPEFIASVFPYTTSFQLLNGFIVLTLSDDVAKKEKDAQ